MKFRIFDSMGEEDRQYFHVLKESLTKAFRLRYPECQKPIREWKGQEIVDFQEDLQVKVKGRISEKWFYTHIKSDENARLPRIDILNMLSEYAGFRNWNDFVHQQSTPVKREEVQELPHPQAVLFSEKRTLLSKNTWILAVLIIAGLGILGAMGFRSEKAYAFCFVDAYTGKSIEQKIEVAILKEGESPVAKPCDKKGCYAYKGNSGKLTFEVKALYYKPDTIIRMMDERGGEERISLKTDDYALMIHLFSTGNLKDWKKRRNQLDEMISDEARIFQVYGTGTQGMALYNKTEFIDKMTMPLKSLKNIEILETIYDNREKIEVLRFIQKEEK